MARTPRDNRALPAVLASPMLADRLAVELETAALAVPGETPMDRERRAFLASASAQVATFGTGHGLVSGQGYTEPEHTTNGSAPELEYR
jgi:hypothetical protein